MDFNSYKALSFDCYGTLIDWEAGILDALRPWLSRVGCSLEQDRLLEAFARCESAIEQEHPDWLYPDVLREVVDRLSRELELPADPADRDRLAASVGDWPAFSDSKAALAALGSRFELLILSNVDQASFARSNARLDVTFELIITAQDVGSYKPDLANFQQLLEACARRGIEPDQLLHVAQSLHHDIEPARELGLSCVWIDRRGRAAGHGATMPPKGDVRADATFASLREFAEASLA